MFVRAQTRRPLAVIIDYTVVSRVQLPLCAFLSPYASNKISTWVDYLRSTPNLVTYLWRQKGWLAISCMARSDLKFVFRFECVQGRQHLRRRGEGGMTRCNRNLRCGLCRGITGLLLGPLEGFVWRWTCRRKFSTCESYVSPAHGLLLRCEKISMSISKNCKNWMCIMLERISM